ncbi:MAG: cupredoxin domain-containing protein [Actinomycetota bacterium]
MFSKVLLPLGVMLALITAACGDSEQVGSGTEDDPQVIEVSALDTLAYDPAVIEVTAGETVRFVVTNEGETGHEFVLGDEEAQAIAEQEMSEGMHGHSAAMAALTLAPGETKEATVTFDDAGTLEYACHVAGHYEGGMIGTLSVA